MKNANYINNQSNKENTDFINNQLRMKSTDFIKDQLQALARTNKVFKNIEGFTYSPNIPELIRPIQSNRVKNEVTVEFVVNQILHLGNLSESFSVMYKEDKMLGCDIFTYRDSFCPVKNIWNHDPRSLVRTIFSKEGNLLSLKELNRDDLRIHPLITSIEDPHKLYKRNGFYYVMCEEQATIVEEALELEEGSLWKDIQSGESMSKYWIANLAMLKHLCLDADIHEFTSNDIEELLEEEITPHTQALASYLRTKNIVASRRNTQIKTAIADLRDNSPASKQRRLLKNVVGFTFNPGDPDYITPIYPKDLPYISTFPATSSTTSDSASEATSASTKQANAGGESSDSATTVELVYKGRNLRYRDLLNYIHRIGLTTPYTVIFTKDSYSISTQYLDEPDFQWLDPWFEHPIFTPEVLADTGGPATIPDFNTASDNPDFASKFYKAPPEKPFFNRAILLNKHSLLAKQDWRESAFRLHSLACLSAEQINIDADDMHKIKVPMKDGIIYLVFEEHVAKIEKLLNLDKGTIWKEMRDLTSKASLDIADVEDLARLSADSSLEGFEWINLGDFWDNRPVFPYNLLRTLESFEIIGLSDQERMDFLLSTQNISRTSAHSTECLRVSIIREAISSKGFNPANAIDLTQLNQKLYI